METMKPLKFEKRTTSFRVLRRRPRKKRGEPTKYDQLGNFPLNIEGIPDELEPTLSESERKCFWAFIDELRAEQWQIKLANAAYHCESTLYATLEGIKSVWANAGTQQRAQWAAAMFRFIDGAEQFLGDEDLTRKRVLAHFSSPIMDLAEQVVALEEKAENNRRKYLGVHGELVKAEDKLMYTEAGYERVQQELITEKERHSKTREELVAALEELAELKK